jgi:ABC-2 type transport system ATP-binding protein
MTTEAVIETCRLTKSYGRHEAVRELNLSVPAGGITAFLGKNGAGKSTTIKMLLGMIAPTSGEGVMLGTRIGELENHRDCLRRVAYVAENMALYRYMTVEQMIRFARSFYPDWRESVAAELLHVYSLPLDRKIKSLSKGMRTKLVLLLAFARKPELLILDEPSEGLDPVAHEHLLQTLVTRSAEGVSIFVSSHQIAEIERIADHVCVLDRGALVLHASLDELRQFYRRIDMVFARAPREEEFRVPGVERIQIEDNQATIFTRWNTEEILERAKKLNAISVQVEAIGLREIFLETVKER